MKIKIISVTTIALLFFVRVHAQQIVVADSTVEAFKIYLGKKTRAPSVAMENHAPGTVVIGFKIDSNKIVHLHIIKSLSSEFDAEVLRVFGGYHQPILLPSAEYSAAITFVLQHGDHKNNIVPIDKTPYQNFLFELNVVTIGIY